MRLLLALAAQFDGVLGFDLYSAERLAVDEANQRAQKKVCQQNKAGGDHTRDQLAGTRKCSDHRRAPKGRGGVEAANVDAFAKDHAGPGEADPGNDLRGDARWTAIGGNCHREDDEPGGPYRNERIRPKARHALPPLSLETDDGAEQKCGAETEGDFARVHCQPSPRWSEPDMGTDREDRDRAAVTVVSRMVNELIVERDVGEAKYGNAVICFKDLLRPGIRQPAVADDPAQTAGGEIQLSLVRDAVGRAGQSDNVIRAPPARAGQCETRRNRLVDLGEIDLLHGASRQAGASKDAKIGGDLLFEIEPEAVLGPKPADGGG